MRLKELLGQNKAVILQEWFTRVADTYPPETARFLREEKDRFANPVGYALRQGMAGLWEELFHEVDPGRARAALDRIIRIRAVQDLTPAQAVGFIFIFKEVIREKLAGELRESRVPVDDWLELASHVDYLALLAFNIYVECREKIAEIKINEVHQRTHRLLERANLVAEQAE